MLRAKGACSLLDHCQALLIREWISKAVNSNEQLLKIYKIYEKILTNGHFWCITVSGWKMTISHKI